MKSIDPYANRRYFDDMAKNHQNDGNAFYNIVLLVSHVMYHLISEFTMESILSFKKYSFMQ